ncbi:threonine/serine exporter family protein [Lutibacter sp. TH_r2]|uniref:threonine/serine ThrE exporter family protein n=1 Tax=Lutibacter sp. TH_r2 TaxID=3082083 RepID=UPI00295480D2|nr:threonine/serine exporter family protein [Lutibacter sp. TH_r2]MDV7188358.1 threonine/serine exporter family protein [Lutibacter sp. TH_r2]
MKPPKKYQFIIELGKALHIYGIPSYKIQSYLSKVAKQQGIKGVFMDLPTWINYTFYDDENSYNYVECIPPGYLNLGALSRIDEVTNKVIENNDDGFSLKEELDLIHIKTKKINHFVLTLAYTFASGAFSLMIGTNWISFGFSLLLGALVYFMVYLSTRSSYLETVLESLVSFVITVLACLIYLVFPDFNVGISILSAIIIFIPGLAITTALEEITSKSLVSGGAKLFDSLISLFKQFFGALLGVTLMSSFINFQLLNHTSEMPNWIMFCAIPIFSITLLPIFQVRRKDMLLGVLTGVTGFFLTVAFSNYGILISTFIGTIAVVTISKLFSKITKSPKTVYLIQGIIMLVPGSKSFMGLSNSFLKSSIINTTNLFEQVAFILMGIIGGLIFAGVFRQPSN